ncbi:prophage ps2 probable integrase [Bacilli bacterium]|nr:prophage ps2 probable integrase [Bacilli bacterium]
MVYSTNDIPRKVGILFYRKTSNGKYRYYEKYYDESEGKWKQATITLNSKTRQAQGEARRKLEAKIEKKLLEDDKVYQQKQANIKLTLREVYEEHLLFRKQELKASSFVKQKGILDSIFRDILDKPLYSISSNYFQKYFIMSSCSLTYKRLQKTLVNLLFKYALKVGYIEANPIDNVELPKQRKSFEEIDRQRTKFFSKEEMKIFKQSFGETPREVRMNCMIEFMYYTGLRVGEVLALMWENVSIENRTINIKYNIDRHSVSLTEFKLTTPKTVTSYRLISINARCIEILTKMKQLNLEIKPKNKKFIFLNTAGSLILPDALNRYLKQVGKKANLENKNYHDFSSHMLRHSHISLLTELAIPIKAIMERVGHKDEKTTIQIYTHVTEKMKDEVDNKLNDFEV